MAGNDETYIVLITDPLGIEKERRITNPETLAGIVVGFYINTIARDGEVLAGPLLDDRRSSADGSELSIRTLSGKVVDIDAIYNGHVVINQRNLYQENLYIVDIGLEGNDRLLYQGTKRFGTAIGDTLRFLNTQDVSVYQQVRQRNKITFNHVYNDSPENNL